MYQRIPCRKLSCWLTVATVSGIDLQNNLGIIAKPASNQKQEFASHGTSYNSFEWEGLRDGAESKIFLLDNSFVFKTVESYYLGENI